MKNKPNKRTGITDKKIKAIFPLILKIIIKDRGCGIEDVSKAMEPLFTTDPENERSGMGFTVMESFTDKVKVKSVPHKGTKVTMTKKLTPM